MIEGLFTLPTDVRLDPIESLPDTSLTGVDYKSGDFALTRPRSRLHTQIVNDSTAKLLQIFRVPATIADAVIQFSRTEQADPAAVLEEAFPVLRTLIEAGVLLPSDSHLASPIDFLIGRGERVGDLVVDRPVAVVIDTEVYRARTADGRWAAIKIGRPGSEGRLTAALQHEAEILALLDGVCSPRLMARGEHDGRPFIAMEWCRGVDALAAAEVARSRGVVDTRALQAIVLAIVDAYAALHERHVVHGDVHPRNLLIDSAGRARIIDFGQAHDLREGQATRRPGRGVVDLYMEPELARARLAGDTQPPPTPAGEQYSIAALLYLLMTGAHTHDFVLEERQMLRQVLGEAPGTLAERGLSSFDHVERVLRRALEKCPDARFASVREFNDALQEALDRDCDDPVGIRRPGRDANTARSALLDELIERSALGGPLIIDGIEPPTASVNLGAAGLAVAMLRMAQQREDGALLAVADVWSQTAIRELQSPVAFTAPDLEMSRELVGDVSLYHSRPGVLCVAALVADAQQDELRRQQAVERFVAAVASDDARAELVFGLSGALLGCGFLLDAVGATPGDEERILRSLGDGLSARLLDQLGRLPVIGDAADSGSLGVAHGYAGILYSLLQWAQVSKTAVPGDLQPRIEQLADLAQPAGRGLGWPVSAHSRRGLDGMRATWCNGAAGHLHLYLLAHALLGEPRYLEMAEGAAWTCYEAPSTGGDLCCGSAGRAYALLRFFRSTGDQLWLDRAHALAEHAATAIRQRRLRGNSLYRGEVGVCLLAADLDDPVQARMPMFELP